MTVAAPIEDFLEAITSQLDATQDRLRLKAVNRPLTFALKDFAIDLCVFVELDSDGQIRLRPAGPNETGASTINISFTTVTRPMIEENTISMELTQSPSLEEMGLAPEETKQLARVGVHNVAQLEKLRERTDEQSVARFSGVDVGRLRHALQTNRPRIDYVQIGSRGPSTPNRPGPGGAAPRLQVRPGQSQLRLRGQRLQEGGATLRARLDGQEIPVLAASLTHADIALPDIAAGTLSIELPDGSRSEFDLVCDDPVVREPTVDAGAGPDDSSTAAAEGDGEGWE